ncbi:Clp1-interacting protein Nsk1 [Schizosaccharomyces cryophilus OY26]|uniref:Clp1-interacting protein Nsk1 n=1 Tax=Schizosaccharomyces cryophilus (strain OY26 / ATCC MYA-4695 / CBS 11777 / NBRC 106824 / NRRL Y48691) TaxID=653667 RepID=S9W4F6_SCHCR|nr:Clp1-interacting protein Nsk1 [Schizosaccharomyces cryophilus OY26]EPY53399.1 Clp1-interacting protein Nsk1 [Schizosaccharomyces cryophilus OY26]
MSGSSRFSNTDITPFLSLPSVPLSSVSVHGRPSFHSSLASSPLRILSPFKPPSSSFPRVGSPSKATSPSVISSLQEKTSTPSKKRDVSSDSSPSPKTFLPTKTAGNEQNPTSTPKMPSSPSSTLTPPGILEQDNFFSARSKRKNNLFLVDENGSSRVVLGTPSRVPSPTKTGSMLNSPPSRVELKNSPKLSTSSIHSPPLRSPVRSPLRTPLSPPSRKRLRAKNEPVSPTPASPSPPPKLPSILGRPRRLAAMEASPAIRRALASSRQTKLASDHSAKINAVPHAKGETSFSKKIKELTSSDGNHGEKALRQRNVKSSGAPDKIFSPQERAEENDVHNVDPLSRRKPFGEENGAQPSQRRSDPANKKPVNVDAKKSPSNSKRKVKWSKKLVHGSSDTEPTSPSRPSKSEPSKSCLASKLRD